MFLKEQSELLWKYKDALRKEVPNDVLKELLEHNQQKIVTGESHVINNYLILFQRSFVFLQNLAY